MKIGGWTVLERTNKPDVPVVSVDALSASDWQSRTWDGDKFAGGFGATQLMTADYWTLRARSAQLFEENLYARGLIRRLVTNEINTGLSLEAIPVEEILGSGVVNDDWTEAVEHRFALWGKNPAICDHVESKTFGALQIAARIEALVCGDVLCVLRQDPFTKLPRLQLISGSAVRTPMNVKVRKGSEVVHGVELNSKGQQVAYWVEQGDPDKPAKRLPAFGDKSGRRLAWLMYGADRRLNEVRGKPILSLVLQSLKEIDRYRDSVQRKAVINAVLAMFIKKGEERIGSMSITGGATRHGTDTTVDSTGAKRTFNVAEQIPGLVLEELQYGEEPQGFAPNGTDEKFGDFEDAIIQSVAWANEVPPEILRLAFSNNYSASQAAINEFKMYLNRIRVAIGEQFCAIIYTEWLLAETLNGKITAPTLLESWRDRRRHDEFGAWIASDWSGQIKPSTDIFKQARGFQMLVDNGWITNARAARELTGTKYSQNVKKLLVENAQKAEIQLLLAPAPDQPESVDFPERGSKEGTG